MKKILITVIFLLGLTAFADEYTDLQTTLEAVGVNHELAVSVAQSTKNAGYSTKNMIRIRSMIQASFKEQAEKIAQKTAEGIAKNVSEDRVMGALEKVQSRYEYAKQIAVKAKVSAKTMNNVTDLTADAMAAGAKIQNLEKVAAAIAEQKEEREQYAVAVMSLYREMARYGTEDIKSSEVAVMAMKKLNVQQINEYKKAFVQNAAYGGANQTADTMGRNMSRGESASSMGNGSGSGGSGSGSGSGSGGSGGSGGGSGGGGGKH